MRSLTPFLRVCLIAVLAMVLTVSYGQKRKDKFKISVNGMEVREQAHCFNLSGELSNRKVIPLDIREPGLFTARVEWEGGAPKLALILNGPGQTSYYARTDGASPLYLQFEFTREQWRAEGRWQLSVVNFQRETTATGTALLYYPVAKEAPDDEGAVQTDEPSILYADFMKLDRSAWGKGQNQFLPDGSFRIDFPNGFYILRKPDKSLSFYNAEERILYKVIQWVLHMDVQTADAPPSVDSFTGTTAGNAWLEDFYAWIDGVNNSLLKEIRILLDQDQAMINNYLTLEKNKTVFELLTFRLEMLDELRELCKK